MRPRLTTLLLLVLLGLSFGAWTHFDRLAERERLVEDALRAQRTIQSEIRLRSLLKGAENSPQGWVLEVKSSWFSPGEAENPLLADFGRPWMDVAGDGERRMRHPENRIARKGDAAWWYNPAHGVVRGRVPDQGTDRATIELYEFINRAP